MGNGGAPQAVLRPGVIVGVLNGASRALLAGTIVAMLVAPVAWALGAPVVSLSAGLVGLGVLVACLWAVIRHYTVEYWIYEKKIEVTSGLVNRETRIAPRSDVRYVSLSAGTLASQVGGGDVVVDIRRHNTKYRMTLRDIADAERWYDELRPVEGGEPLGRFDRRIGPSVFTVAGYLALGVGAVTALLAGVAVVALPPLSLPLVGLWGVTLWFPVTAWYFIYVAGVEYRVYDDHIERRRIFLGTERSYAIADHIDGVEHIRYVPERAFDVGTVSLELRWRERPFHLRSVDGSSELYQDLRQSA
ncbi:PH domain-containing protein [Halomicroarcula sp. F28]|uniref:PH domain-containing protein n=1 Tax=Haloarcula salinisoli TaxID=2487746 RepID=UPI001C72A9FA|nr:PH domain-containing protein [Halomicroarcula salinisoli]MBX0285948.1 PH domain-containing protein [Halomicroarcula salinisoli]